MMQGQMPGMAVDYAPRRMNQMQQPQMPQQAQAALGIPRALPQQAQAMAHANPNAAFMRQDAPMANPNMPQMPQQAYGMMGQRPQYLADLAPNGFKPFNGRY